MVKHFLLFIFIGMAMAKPLLSVDVKVTAEVDNGQAYTDQPVKGMVMVTHDKNVKIDPDSFQAGKEKLKVEFVKDVLIAPTNPLIISLYHFELPPKAAGLYMLPAISVKVGNSSYQSVLSTYEVVGGPPPPLSPAPPQLASPPPAPSEPPPITPGPPVLQLEASVEGQSSLYPGQRTKLVYRYLYRGDIRLTEEKLPLLDARGFNKIGEKEFANYTENGLSVNEISQVIEAIQPGTFTFGPSLAAGTASSLSGEPQQLSAEAPAIAVTVLPFPEKNKPSSFNGAVGEFQIADALANVGEVGVGDEISLSLTITGKGNVTGVPLPEICCQPAFSGFFRFSDLPPEEEVKGNSKIAVYKLRPLNGDIQAIPSVEFSYFDPETAQYVRLHTPPIPLKVQPENALVLKAPPLSKKSQAKAVTEPKTYRPAPLEGEEIYPLTPADLYNTICGTWWVPAFIPLGLGLMAYQLHLRDYLDRQRRKSGAASSQEMLSKAWKMGEGSSEYFEGIAKGLKLALKERQQINSADVADEDLPKQGVSGEVRAFLIGIQAQRFGGMKKLEGKSIRSQAEELWRKISKSSWRVSP